MNTSRRRSLIAYFGYSMKDARAHSKVSSVALYEKARRAALLMGLEWAGELMIDFIVAS